MKLADTMTYINQALNYPAIDYTDVSLYFDSAISELNTTLHTDIPLVSTMISEYKKYLTDNVKNIIRILEDPNTNSNIQSFNTEYEFVSSSSLYGYIKSKNMYALRYTVNSAHSLYKEITGYYISEGVPTYWISVAFNVEDPIWIRKTEMTNDDLDLEHYLPDDWVMLWLIPYVCFKYTVRDGGTASTFAEELQQGFQQLQESYDVPAYINLVSGAGKVAYTELVKKYLPNIDIKVSTRAIYKEMKHARSVNAVYGNMYDRGGFYD